MIDKIEIERIIVDENHEAYPLVVYYIKSGFPDKFIQITENPFDGPECELVTESEKAENIKKLEQNNEITVLQLLRDIKLSLDLAEENLPPHVWGVVRGFFHTTHGQLLSLIDSLELCEKCEKICHQKN